MRIFYITLNHETDARQVAKLLLTRRDAVCCNWFPITCSYVWEGEIKEGAEVVLIVKTVAEKHDAVRAAVAEVIDYTNFIGEIEIASVNQPFAAWLQSVVQ